MNKNSEVDEHIKLTIYEKGRLNGTRMDDEIGHIIYSVHKWGGLIDGYSSCHTRNTDELWYAIRDSSILLDFMIYNRMATTKELKDWVIENSLHDENINVRKKIMDTMEDTDKMTITARCNQYRIYIIEEVFIHENMRCRGYGIKAMDNFIDIVCDREFADGKIPIIYADIKPLQSEFSSKLYPSVRNEQIKALSKFFTYCGFVSLNGYIRSEESNPMIFSDIIGKIDRLMTTMMTKAQSIMLKMRYVTLMAGIFRAEVIFKTNPAYSHIWYRDLISPGNTYRENDPAEIEMIVHRLFDEFVVDKLEWASPDYTIEANELRSELSKFVGDMTVDKIKDTIDSSWFNEITEEVANTIAHLCKNISDELKSTDDLTKLKSFYFPILLGKVRKYYGKISEDNTVYPVGLRGVAIKKDNAVKAELTEGGTN